MTEHKEYPIKIVHTCGHTEFLYRSISEPAIKVWVERQEKKTCGCIQCKGVSVLALNGEKCFDERWLTSSQ
mgnify:CR=1 FL=1